MKIRLTGCGVSLAGRRAMWAIYAWRERKMNYEKTELYFLQKDLMRRFGDEEGQKIFSRASKLYAELSVTTDYKNSATLERQLKRLVYPVIALYKTLLAFGYKIPNALGIVRTETEKAARETAGVLANQMRPIFPYRAFRRNIRNFMEYKFPSGGWKSAGLCVRGKKISFRIEHCLYYSITEKFGCPELCGVFCDYERAAFGGLRPQVEFECGGMLANGHEFCDFRFLKGSKRSRGQ